MILFRGIRVFRDYAGVYGLIRITNEFRWSSGLFRGYTCRHLPAHPCGPQRHARHGGGLQQCCSSALFPLYLQHVLPYVLPKAMHLTSSCAMFTSPDASYMLPWHSYILLLAPFSLPQPLPVLPPGVSVHQASGCPSSPRSVCGLRFENHPLRRPRGPQAQPYVPRDPHRSPATS